MIIQITDKLRINSDEHAWMLQKDSSYISSKTGERIEKWDSFKWFTKLETALKSAGEYVLRTEDFKDLKEAVTRFNEITASVQSQLGLNTEEQRG